MDEQYPELLQSTPRHQTDEAHPKAMSSTTWSRVSDLLQEALDVAPEAREQLLNQRCQDDLPLRREVEALLAIDTRALEAQERPVFTFFGASSTTELDSVGPYELLKEIGRGGMASVHLARDPSLENSAPVAIKLLKRGMDSDEIIRHFHREGEILARLRHPNITALLGGGSTEEHTPYLVMEYVDGVPIDRFCDQNQLDVESRVRLFLKVCDAVQHAHRNLVLHRDLKPSNILVTHDGEPKLLDFGISKWLHPETARPLTITAIGFRAMTPQYAGPEQIRGEPATIACDIYALGAVLYQLLTGRLPFEPTDGRSLLQQITEDEPPRPSSLFRGTFRGSSRGTREDTGEDTREDTGEDTVDGRQAPKIDASHTSFVRDPRRRHRELKGDLDNIIAKALRKEPEKRYPSAQHLAEDLRSYLNHRPVSAGAASTAYRLKKALQRNRGAAVLTALLLFTLFGALVGREKQQRQVRLERDRAFAGQQFLIEIFAEADPHLGKDGRLEVGEVLSRGVERIDRLQDQPELQGPLLTVLGEIYLNLGRFDEARTLLRRSIDVQDASTETDALEAAKAQNILGQLFAETSQTEDAERYLKNAIESFKRLGQDEQLGGALTTLALNLRNEGRFDEAMKTGLESLSVLRECGSERTRTYIIGLNNLGFIAYGQGDLALAESYFHQSLRKTRELQGEDHPDMALALNNVASVAIADDRFDDALQPLEQAIALWRRFLDPSHPNLFTAQINIAALLQKSGESEQAVRRLTDLLPALKEALGQQHPLWAQAMLWLARAEQSSGRVEQSLRIQEQSLAVVLEAHGEVHPLTAEILHSLATSLQTRDPSRAIALLKQVYRIEIELFGEDHPTPIETAALLKTFEDTSLHRGRLATIDD